jgi:hypothetical protein
MEAYRACEIRVPDFSQPEYIMPDSPELQTFEQRRFSDAMSFVQCAHDEGFIQFAHPLVSNGPAVSIPDGLSPEMFRTVLESCWVPGYNFMWHTSVHPDSDPELVSKFTILQEFW